MLPKFAESLLEKFTYNASIVFNQCTSVVIMKVAIMNNAGITGIAAKSIIGISNITQLSIEINCSNCPNVNGYPMHIDEIVFLYEDWDAQKHISLRKKDNSLTITSFFYKMHGSCSNPSQ